MPNRNDAVLNKKRRRTIKYTHILEIEFIQKRSNPAIEQEEEEEEGGGVGEEGQMKK